MIYLLQSKKAAFILTVACLLLTGCISEILPPCPEPEPPVPPTPPDGQIMDTAGFHYAHSKGRERRIRRPVLPDCRSAGYIHIQC